MTRGIFSRSMVHLLVGAVVLVIYGSTLLFSLVPRDGISWQGHLFGGIGGVIAAWALEARRTSSPSRSPSTLGSRDVAREFPIRGEVIRLGQLLKAAGLADSGVDAKELLLAGDVRVNGEPETRRGRQLRPGDVVELGDETVEIR